MQIRLLVVALGCALAATMVGVGPLSAQCKKCTSSHSCALSEFRGFCSYGCTESGVCSCADAKCDTVIKPDAMLTPGLEGILLAALTGQVYVETFLVTACDGSRQAVARVATPFGAGLIPLGRPENPLRPAAPVPADAAVLETSTASG